jgi:hypothetical protein
VTPGDPKGMPFSRHPMMSEKGISTSQGAITRLKRQQMLMGLSHESAESCSRVCHHHVHMSLARFSGSDTEIGWLM